MISKAPKSTSQSLAQLAADDIMATVFQDTIPPGADTVDSRRRLEDRLEEIRLRREMREFDFEF